MSSLWIKGVSDLDSIPQLFHITIFEAAIFPPLHLFDLKLGRQFRKLELFKVGNVVTK